MMAFFTDADLAAIDNHDGENVDGFVLVLARKSRDALADRLVPTFDDAGYGREDIYRFLAAYEKAIG